MSQGVFDPDGGGGGGITPAKRVQRVGRNFVTDDGIWKVKGITAFTAFQDFLEGRLEKLETYAAFTNAIGVNCWRIFGMWNNTRFDARAYGQAYYTKLNDFTTWCNERGIVPWFVVFTDQVDGSPIKMNQAEQFGHMTLVQDALRSKPALLECVNEDRKNGQIAPNFSNFQGLTATRSWWDEGASYLQVGSLLDFTTSHPDRGIEWTRKTQHVVEISRFGYDYPGGFAEPTQRPHVIGEPRRIAEGTTPRQHADAAAWSLLAGGGYILHGGYAPDPRHESDLQRCNVPLPETLARECCEAAGAVYKATINLGAAATGRFLHGNFNDDGECPVYHRDRYNEAANNPAGAVRTYFLDTGGRMDGLALDPGPEHPDSTGRELPTRNGWTITERVGYRGNIVTVRR